MMLVIFKESRSFKVLLYLFSSLKPEGQILLGRFADLEEAQT